MSGKVTAILMPFFVALTIMIIPIHSETAKQNPKGLKILASTFPMALFTRNVVNGAQGVEVDLMLSPNLGCPHDYVLTPQDMEKIRRADVFIANGLGLEEFLGDAMLKVNPEMVVVDTSREIEDLISMERDEHHEGRAREHHPPRHDDASHRHSHAHTKKGPETREQDEESTVPNPHLFASPRLAIRIVTNIAAALASADPANAQKYKSNADLYASRLKGLLDEMITESRGFKSRSIVTQHAVFDYLARDMGLEIVAVVQEHPGQEPSAAEMIDLVKVIKQSGAAAIFTEPQYPAKIGAVLAREAGIQVADLDPVASGPENAPLDHYEKTMRANLSTIKRILEHGGK
jgi:zinc transport system substrate-binding protein